MTMTDEQIAAWLHKSVDADQAAQIEAAMAQDEALAARAARIGALDALARHAVPLEPELPEALRARLGLAPAVVADNVVDLAAVRTARALAAKPAATRSGFSRSDRWRVAAQLLVILSVGFAASQWRVSPTSTDDAAAYRALGDSRQTAANALLMFAPDIDARAAKAMIVKAGAQSIGAPSAAGVWQIYVAPAQRDATLAALRGMAAVQMAEPISGNQP